MTTPATKSRICRRRPFGKMDDLLQISPSELCFVYAHNSELKNVINLRNLLRDGRCVAFKVKCNNGSRYMVRPTSGIVKPGASVNVKIYMVPQISYSDELRSCKDRFLIQTVPTKLTSEGDVTTELFDSQYRQM